MFAAAVSCIFFLPSPVSPSATRVSASGRGRGRNMFHRWSHFTSQDATSADADRASSVKIASAKNTKSATVTPKRFCIRLVSKAETKHRRKNPLPPIVNTSSILPQNRYPIISIVSCGETKITIQRFLAQEAIK